MIIIAMLRILKEVDNYHTNKKGSWEDMVWYSGLYGFDWIDIKPLYDLRALQLAK